MSQISLVSTDIVKWVAYGPCRVLAVYGFNPNAATDCYIQFHLNKIAAGSTTANNVANNTVPQVKALYAPANTGFSYGTNAFGEEGLDLPELLVAVSTVQASFTAAATALNMTVVVESDYLVSSGTTVVGDLTTGVASLQVWAHSTTNTKRLLRLDFANGGAAPRYPLIQARDTLGASNRTNILKSVSASGTVNYIFGKGGGNIEEEASPGTRYKGCIVGYAAEGSAGYVVSPLAIGAATTNNIRAIYE